MSSRAEASFPSLSRAARTLAVVALAFESACGMSGDQLLGTIQPGEGVIRTDASAGGTDAGAACTYSPYPARAVGEDLDVYFVVDRSMQSMFDPTGDKWDRLESAFTQYFHTNPTGMGMGIGYFPLGGNPDGCSRCRAGDCGCLMACGCSCDQRMDPRNCPRGGTCDPSSYQRPDVEIGPMPQNAGALVTSLFGQGPFGATTIRPALRGSLDYAATYAASHSDERVVVVLVAGGPPSPNDCSPDAISDCAETAGNSNIRTHVVAFDYQGASLGPIADRGGGKLFQFDSRDDVTVRLGDLVEALRSERPCEYDLPPSGPLDYGRVNVEISFPADAGSNASSTLVSYQVASRSACNGGPGWYYDRPDRPTRIIACDDACRKIHGPPEASVTIKVGCPTVPPPH